MLWKDWACMDATNAEYFLRYSLPLASKDSSVNQFSIGGDSGLFSTFTAYS